MSELTSLDQVFEDALTITSCGKQIPAFKEYAAELATDLISSHNAIYAATPTNDPQHLTTNKSFSEFMGLRTEAETLKKQIMAYIEGRLDYMRDQVTVLDWNPDKHELDQLFKEILYDLKSIEP